MAFGVGGSYIAVPAQLAASVITSPKLASDVIPSAFTSLNVLFNTAVAGTWAWSADASQASGGYLLNTTTAQNDEVKYSCYMSAGTYTLTFLTLKAGGCGIMSVYIDTDLAGTIDCYAAVTAFNQQLSLTGVAVATSGFKDLSIKIASKNGASADYEAHLTGIAIYRTA